MVIGIMAVSGGLAYYAIYSGKKAAVDEAKAEVGTRRASELTVA